MAMFAKGFDVLYLEHCGHSGASIGAMAFFTGFASLIASPLNGAIPDMLARKSATHGRPCAAQVSVVAGALAFVVWVTAAPRVTTFVVIMGMCAEILVGGWVTPGVKLPILTEIVPAAQRASTMAWLATLEGSTGGVLGPPSVGFLAEHVF